MDRLTTRIEDKVYYSKGKYEPATLIAEMETSEIRECISKLAEYEDIGIEPERIKGFLGNFGISVVMKNTKLMNELRKHKDLEEQGKLIRLPLKVGDKAILIFNDSGELFITDGWVVEEITIVEDDMIASFKCYDTDEEEERSLKGFGISIFLTRAEAEKAVAIMKY